MSYQQVTPRAKEWVPLCTQQLRLRNLLQILAANLQLDMVVGVDGSSEKKPSPPPNDVGLSARMQWRPLSQRGIAVHYTLHVTMMSPPFYTSEKLADENPRWKEIEPGRFAEDVNTALPGVIIRIWASSSAEQWDKQVTMWGVYFSGLTYIGHTLPCSPALFSPNTIILRMQGGYFTAVDCLVEPVEKARIIQASISAAEVQPSYSVNLLSRLHTIQRAIRQQMQTSQRLRDEIIARGFENKENVPRHNQRRTLVGRKLISPAKTAQKGTIMKLKIEMENVRFRVKLLQGEKEAKQKQVKQLLLLKDVVMEENQEKGTELLGKFQDLHKEKEKLEEWHTSHAEHQELFLQTQAQLVLRQKQLISELNIIYPIAQLPNNLYTICDVHLPDSEDFMGHEELMISVALGYVAHTSQMISYFLQVPLRYPVHHYGSRSCIVDHIIDKLPDKDREFPLYSKGKDKYQFKYGVYLLNKNIAQLRWCCGLPTRDLRTTLPNLAGLLQLYPGTATKLSDPPLLTFSRTRLITNQPPKKFLPRLDKLEGGSDPGGAEERASSLEHKGHRYSKSMDIQDLKLMEAVSQEPSGSQGTAFSDTEWKSGDIGEAAMLASSTSLSYSLDKGLDEFEAMTKSGGSSGLMEASSVTPVGTCNGSEPSLAEAKMSFLEVGINGVEDQKKQFLQEWHSEETPMYYVEEDPALHPEKLGSVFGESSDTQETLADEEGVIRNHSEDTVSDKLTKEEVLLVDEEKSDTEKSDSKQAVKDKCPYCDIDACVEHKCREEKGSEMDSLDMDSSWANVASRTEALANRTSSFNLVRSRHNTVEDCIS